MTEACPPEEWMVEWRHRVPSTNDELKQKARRGAPSGTVLAAGAQDEGQGRGENAWESPPGGVYASVLLREVPVALARLMPLAAGIAVVRTLDALHVPAATWLKWPNDILAAPVDADRPYGKAGGILCESASKGNRIDWIVVGIGVNLRTDPKLLPKDIDPPAVSFAEYAERLPTTERFLDRFLDVFEEVLAEYVDDPPRLVSEHSHDYAWLGEEVTLTLTEERNEAELTGTFLGITETGAIRLEVAGDEVVVEPWNAETLRPV